MGFGQWNISGVWVPEYQWGFNRVQARIWAMFGQGVVKGSAKSLGMVLALEYQWDLDIILVKVWALEYQGARALE